MMTAAVSMVTATIPSHEVALAAATLVRFRCNKFI
jgi:hypothetical protein